MLQPSSSPTASHRPSRRTTPGGTGAGGMDLASQLAQIQDAYRMIQADAAKSEQRLELSTQPGLQVKRVSIVGPPRPTQNALTAGELYDIKRRALSTLTLDLIMTLQMEQIVRMRASFEEHGGVVTVAQFVAIMASHLDVTKLKATPDVLIRSLVELFDSMDLDGDGCFDEDTRLLTNEGFLFGHEIRARLESYRADPQNVPRLRFACYDAESKQIQYHPCKADRLIVDFKPIAQHGGDLVDFTPQGEIPRWAPHDSSTTAEHAEQADLSFSNGVSIRVTRNHRVFAQWGQKRASDSLDIDLRSTDTGSDVPHEVTRADFFLAPVSAVSYDTAPHGLKFLSNAEEGVERSAEERAAFLQVCSSLELKPCERCVTGKPHSEADPCQVLSFLELYGFWLGNGALENNDTLSVLMFRQLNGKVTPGDDLAVPLSDDVKSFAPWVLELLGAEQLRMIVRGLERADANSRHNLISTSSALFRDQLVRVLLHAGYTAMSQVIATKPVSWSVTWANAAHLTKPLLHLGSDVKAVPYTGRVWCVEVDHPDHLVIGQRAHRDEFGVVTQQSRPIIIGNSLEFEELLTTVVHMGMAATEHLLLTPISPYREGPQYLVSMHQIEREVSFIKEREAICVIDSGAFAFRLHDPALKHSLAVELPISSALSVVYVTGVQVDMQQNQGSYKRSSVAKASYYTSGKPSASDERAKARALAADHLSQSERTKTHMESMWDKLSGMPLSKPMRMENGQPITHARQAGQDDDDAQTTKPATSQLFSEYAAKPYYGSGSSLHAFTSAKNGTTSSTSSNAPSSSSSSTNRTPLVFIHEDYLVTSTSQHLQIWDGFPTGPATLCDSKKIRNSYSVLKWCSTLQRLFAGDVHGGIDVWKIVLLPAASSLAPPNKPTLQKERELTGHTDIITGLESISSMGFLLSASLDASVRMYDLQAGTLKNVFIGHRAGIVAIAYSNEYRFLLSAGSDHQVCVWSPFAEAMVYSLRGHTAPLIGVQFVPGTPQIVTADSSGWMRIWDARNWSCTQTFFTVANITSFTACSQRHKRIFVVGKGHEMHVFEQEGGPFLKRKSEEAIFVALYSPFTMTMLTANREDVKVYDGLTGNLARVYRGLAESDLTAVCLDARQRKLFVGDQQGRIRCYNYVTGAYMKSLTPHKEEIIAMAYSGSRRLLVSATDRHVFVHDERPIEEQVLYMTTSSAEGTEYLVIAVSEKLSSLACAMSNGRVELWNLDQAMRDVPLQGGHPDVITAMLFVDSHQLLLSADDSGSIMAWFVRPSRWKGQLAFELRTPPTRMSAAHQLAAALSKQREPNDDPIRAVQGLSSNVPGISCMGFHAPSSQLFTGHRNGAINVWNIKPLLDFLARVSADANTSWFAPTPSSSTVNSAIGSPQLRPRTGMLGLHSKRASNTLGLPELGFGSAATHSLQQATTMIMPANLSVKDQLSMLAGALRPSLTIAAHDAGVSTLHVVLDPPALLSTTNEHMAHVWTLEGEPMGELDPVSGLARGYAASAGVAYKAPAGVHAPAWEFHVNVAAREHKDRSTTHAVLQDLEAMAHCAAEAAEREYSSTTSSASSTRGHSRVGSAHALNSHSRGNSAAMQINLPVASGAASPAKSLAAALSSTHLSTPSKPSTGSRTPATTKDLASTQASPAGAFFLSTPMSPIDNVHALTKGSQSPSLRAKPLASATTSSATPSRRVSTSISGSPSSSQLGSRQVSAGPSPATSKRTSFSVPPTPARKASDD